MGIDPQTIKELLQLQIWNKSSLLTSNRTSEDSGAGSDFSEMLNNLLSQQSTETAGPKTGRIAGLEAMAATNAMRIAPSAAWNRYLHNDSNTGRPNDFEHVIQGASRKFGVDSSLVKAVIGVESSFNPRAISGAGAKGLMQLMDGTGKDLGVTDPFDPKQNIEGGTKYLSNLLMKYNGNQGAALAAYNAGSGRLDKLGIRNDQDLAAKLHLLPEETQQYVRKVTQLKQHYEA